MMSQTGSTLQLDRADNFDLMQHDVVGQQSQHAIDDGVSTSSLDTPEPANLPPEHNPKVVRFSNDKNPKPAGSNKSNPPKSRDSPVRHDSKPGSLSPVGPSTLVPLIQKSSPTLLIDDPAASSSSSTSGGGHLVRSKSVSEPRSGPNITRSQRRNTFSVSSSNRYAPLENVPEES